MGTESLELFEQIKADKNVDYLAIHIWAKNWGWFSGDKLAEGFPNVMQKASEYVARHIPVAKRLNKPLVLEEFGLPRDHHSFDPASSTEYRDKYFTKILSYIGNQPGGEAVIAGQNLWPFARTARPRKGQVVWKTGEC